MKITAIKSLAVMSLVAAAAASQALSFTTDEIGGFTTSTSGGNVTVTSNFNVYGTTSDTPGVEFQSGTFSYTHAAPFPTTSLTPITSGTITLYGPTMADSVTFSMMGAAVSGTNFSESFITSAVLTGATGMYAGYKGTGDLGGHEFNVGVSNGNPYGNTISGFSAQLQAAPEPAGIAALGLGLVGLIRRRVQK